MSLLDRQEILAFLEDAAAQMARLARGDGLPPHVGAELAKIALELDAEAAQLRTELRLDNLAARVANTNRRGLTGLSD